MCPTKAGVNTLPTPGASSIQGRGPRPCFTNWFALQVTQEGSQGPEPPQTAPRGKRETAWTPRRWRGSVRAPSSHSVTHRREMKQNPTQGTSPASCLPTPPPPHRRPRPGLLSGHQGTFCLSGDIFGVSRVGETRDVAKHPITHRTAPRPQQSPWAPSVHSARCPWAEGSGPGPLQELLWGPPKRGEWAVSST